MKKQLFILILVAVALAAPIVAIAAGSCTCQVLPAKNFNVVQCQWTSDSSGAVSGVGALTITGTLRAVNFKSVSGYIPTNLYDVQWLNAGGENLLYDDSNSVNVGADVPSALDATSQRRTPLNKDSFSKKLYNETLTLSITNAGDTKKGIFEAIID